MLFYEGYACLGVKHRQCAPAICGLGTERWGLLATIRGTGCDWTMIGLYLHVGSISMPPCTPYKPGTRLRILGCIAYTPCAK